jgi:hypothetical protein
MWDADMNFERVSRARAVLLVVVLAAGIPSPLVAQRPQGRPIGKVTTIGNLIHIEVAEGVLVPEHPFDLNRRTLRFTPQTGGYRVENVPLRWDPEFGAALQGSTITLRNLRIPFSGKTWSSFNVGSNGQITFDAPEGGAAVPVAASGRGGRGRGGLVMERYAMMETVGTTFINMVPGIAAFTRVQFSGPRYAKELADRAVVTWTLNEGNGGIQAFSWTPTVNRIQAVLGRDGVVELSYDGVNAKDGIVGIFPLVSGGVKRTLATLSDGEDPGVAAHLDIRSIRLDVVDGVFVEATIDTRGAVPADGAAAMNGVAYRIAFDTKTPPATTPAQATSSWTISGATGGAGPAAYTAVGRGVYPQVAASGTTIAVRGVLPGPLADATSMRVFATASAAPAAGMGMPGAVIDEVAPHSVAFSGLRSPEVDFSNMSSATVFPVVYEAFHWSSIPASTDVACTVIGALGDRFDFIASYSDFRVDNPEGGTPSSGPRGGNVTGIASDTRDPGAFCSKGQLQSMYNQPVSTSAVQIEERSPDGRMTDYSYAMSQIAHELGHRWAARMFALVDGERINLGPTHWTAGFNLPSAFPYSKPLEADAMGGSVWTDLGNGRWAQVDRDYYWPPKGFSWFALYLMGLARPDEVPAKDFFLLRNLQRTSESTSEGYPIFTGEKLQLSMDQVIAAMGPRRPAYEEAQKNFRTAIVIMTLPGKPPSPELVRHANAISERWIKYWIRITGGRATMSISPR